MIKTFISVVKLIAPYAIPAILVIYAILFYNYKIDQSHQEGYDAGISYQKGLQEKIDLDEGKRRDAEKERIEKQYQTKVESMSADLNNANSSVDRLQHTISNIREHVVTSTGVEPNGTSTTQIVSVLADLYSESVKQYSAVAEEAERYRLAGEQCEQQYDAIRNTNATSKNTDHKTN